jgi:hypothetical protein
MTRAPANLLAVRTTSWCVAECVAGAPDTGDLREIIYSPDGAAVRRWDRLGMRSTGDSSHLFHTRFSFFRDSIKANRDGPPAGRLTGRAVGRGPGPATTVSQ